MEVSTGFIGPDSRDSGLEFRETYQAAQPFPHIVIEEFLPAPILEACLADFPTALSDTDVRFDRAQERLKFQFHPDRLPARSRALFYAFNSHPFIKVLENITGIKGLVPDPYFLGAGFHEIREGGHLSVHVDFNHHKPMNLERRINVLIYLNKDWKPEFGGELELWNADMSACVRSVLPEFNRCVIFDTTAKSYHGNPNVVRHPEGVCRRSIALYYYTSTWTDAKRDHTTQFQVRQGSDDKPDHRVRRTELLADLIPPLLMRNLRKLKRA
jgi:hypothetical protein